MTLIFGNHLLTTLNLPAAPCQTIFLVFLGVEILPKNGRIFSKSCTYKKKVVILQRIYRSGYSGEIRNSQDGVINNRIRKQF